MSGKVSTDHHPEIEPEDMRKLYESFDIDSNFGLQEKVWVDIMLYLCRRGRENLRLMDKTTFGVGTDATGKRFVFQYNGKYDKNHGIHDDGTASSGEGRIYETGGPKCPVKTFLSYTDHLNPFEKSFWQRPLDKFDATQPIWYYRAPLGVKPLGNMMARLSLKYKLSQRYTNHSIRVTSLQVLEDNNIEGRHAIRISGHKSDQSIKCYARRTVGLTEERNIADNFEPCRD